LHVGIRRVQVMSGGRGRTLLKREGPKNFSEKDLVEKKGSEKDLVEKKGSEKDLVEKNTCSKVRGFKRLSFVVRNALHSIHEIVHPIIVLLWGCASRTLSYLSN